MVTDIWNPIDEETLRELAQLGASKRASKMLTDYRESLLEAHHAIQLDIMKLLHDEHEAQASQIAQVELRAGDHVQHFDNIEDAQQEAFRQLFGGDFGES